MPSIRILAIFGLLMILGCSCGQSSPRNSSLNPLTGAVQQLPGLPQDELPPVQRLGSALNFVTIQCSEWYDYSDGAVANSSDAFLNAAPDGFEWAMYQLPGIDELYKPQTLTRFIADGSGPVIMAVANYATGRWEIVGESGLITHSFNYGGNWQDYVSPAGSLYCALLCSHVDGQLDYLYFTVDDNTPPEVPQNLQATPGELSATLNWDQVTDARVTELRIYHSLNDDMSGASQLGSVPAGATQATYDGLDHTVLHYFTIRSYSAALDQESADSNIASCQPDEPVIETFLPPTGLQAGAAPFAADLSWDSYPDPRASHIRVYISKDSGMADAVLEAELPDTDTSYQVTGLDAGVTYYFALTAWWEAAQLESEMGNIASCIPTDEAIGLMNGLWPRFGGGREGMGFTNLVGPGGLLDITSVSLTGNAASKCHVSPVIDSAGRVYGISRDAQLSCYSPDLSTRHWRTDANVAVDDIPDALPLVVNGQAPLLDSQGNIYFVAAMQPGDGTTGSGFLLSFDKNGTYRWRYALGSINTDGGMPCPSVNMHPDGTIVCVGASQEVLHGVNTSGEQVWVNENGAESERQYFADIAMDPGGLVGLPIWGSGPAIDPRPHWHSYNGASGAEEQTNKAMGTPYNLYGGVFMPNGYFYFPSKNALRSVKASDGSSHDSWEGLVDMIGAPARDANGEFLFFSEDQGGGFSGYASFHCNSFNDDFPPTQMSVWSRSMEQVSVTCKPAVDANYSIFLTDNTGRIIMFKWDKDSPVSEDNPKMATSKQETSFRFSSFAIGNGAAYVISEDNDLYMVGTPLLPD